MVGASVKDAPANQDRRESGGRTNFLTMIEDYADLADEIAYAGCFAIGRLCRPFIRQCPHSFTYVRKGILLTAHVASLVSRHRVKATWLTNTLRGGTGRKTTFSCCPCCALPA